MNTKRKLLTFIFFLSVAIHSISALEDISVKNATEKDVILSDSKVAGFRVKDLSYDANNGTYLIITSESKDQGKTYGQLFISTIEEPQGRVKAQLMSVEEGENLLFLSQDFIGSKTIFYLEVHCNEMCNVKLKFKYSKTVQIPFGKDYQFISSPRKDIVENHFTMQVEKEKFPAVVYIVSPNDFAVYGSSAKVSLKQIKDVVFDEFDGGLIAVLNQTEITEGEGTRTLDFTVYSVPNALVTIGVRKQDAKSVELKVGEKMVYSFIETPSYKECFDFNGASNSTYSMSVVPFKKNLKITDEKGTEIEKDLDYHKTIVFNFGPTETKKTFCFQTSEGNKETIYGFQIEEYTTMNPVKNAKKEPLYHGLIYSLESKKGDATYYRHYRREYLVDALTNMNVNLVKGKIEVYKMKCTTFPDCPTTDDKLKNPVHEVNGFYTAQSDIYMEPSLLSAEQNLIVVKCLSAECGYEVSFFSDSDTMELKEGNRYNQFMIHTETGDYKIRNEDKEATKITVRLIPISGDIYLEAVPNPFVDYNKIYIGTNTIFEITAKEEYKMIKPLVDSFFFVVRASGSGYYSINYEVFRDSSKSSRRVPTGIYSMETMPAKEHEKASFIIKNRKIEEKQPFLASFFPINCDVTIKRTGGKDIVEEDGIFQDIVYETEPDYNKTEYSYDITLTNMEEKATFKDERCVIYVAAIEKGSPIVIGEGHFIQMNLNNKFPQVTYLIPFTNLKKNILANYVIENEIPLSISLTAEGQPVGGKYVTKRNMPFLLTYESYKQICVSGACNLEFTTKVHRQAELENNKNVRFDFIARTQNNVPSYLKKRLLREETVFSDDPYFFITDVGHNEEGEVILNYNKGSGVVSARIVPKNQTDAFPTWGGRYVFPDPYSGESLKYDPFTQSISYGMNQTQYCENGCDLLISVYTMETFRTEKDLNTDYFEDFSIFVKSTQKDDELGGIVDIPINEFVQGHLEKLATGSNKKDAYTLTVNNDCNELYLEIQGELIDVYINFDKKKLPTLDESDFQCISSGENQICKITAKFGSFKGHYLTFIVASQTKETAEEFNAYYLFKFRAPTVGWEKYNIYEINSDHGVKCDVDQGSYCYFLFPLRNYQIYNLLYFFTEGEILSDFTIYANPVNADNYDSSLTLAEVESLIPSESKSKKSSAGSFWKNLLIMDDQSADDFILLAVKSERKTQITFMTTYKENIKSTYPKPKASQIYKVETEGEDSSLILKLPSDRDYEVYMQSIVGSMAVFSKDEDKKSFVIKGNGDSILVSFNENQKPDFETSMEILALEDDSIFYVEYRPKNIKDNFQKIKFGSTTEISFDDVGFPVAFYAKVPENLNEKDYVINFRYLGEHTQFTEKEIDDFKVEASVVDYKWIQRRLKDKTKQPDKITKGIYNSFLRSGSVSIVNDDSFNALQYVYLQMNNSETNPKVNYTDIHIEVSVLPLNEKKCLAPDSQYNHAFLLDDQKECNLHTIKRRFEDEDTMTFEFSTISPNVGFALLKYSDTIKDEDARKSDEDIMSHLKYKIETGGKITWIFKFKEDSGNKFPERIILSVFNNSTEKLAKKDSAYVYRFITSNYDMNPNQLKEDDMKYTYYENNEFIITSSQPTIFLPDDEEVLVSPSDYYIVLLPKGSKYNTQSIAIREIEKHSILFYDTEESKKYLRIKFTKFPSSESDAIAMFAMSDNSVDLFAYKIAHEVTKDPKIKTDIIQLEFKNDTLEYETEDNDDKYVFFFNISIPDIKDKRPFFDVRVKSKDNVTENDLFFSSTEKYPARDSSELISDERLNDALFINKAMMENTKTMHLSVVCEDLCDFKLIISNADNVVISPGDHVRHLFRGEKNFELPVHIVERPAGSYENPNDKKYLTIFTFGGDGIFYPNLYYVPQKNFTDEEGSEADKDKLIEMQKFFNGFVVTVDAATYPLENDGYFSLTVFANSGLISVGARYMNEDEINKYKIFDNEVRGYLLPESKKECFPIDGTPKQNNEIEATIFTTTKVNVFFEKLESTEKIAGTEHTIEYQDSIVFKYEEEAKICFEKADDDAQGTPFAFQLIQNSDFDTQDSYKIASKVNGLVYKQNVDNRRMIYYRHSKYKELKKTGNEENNIINFNLKIIEGDPKFYIHHCEMFPNCEYNNDTIAKYKQDGSLITPTKVGDFFIGSIDTADEKHELSGDQYLVIVDCSTSPIDCLFEISFYDERDKLKLRPSDSFNQFMTKEDNDQFTFTILDPNVKQVDVKLHVLSGNAYIEKTEQPKGVNAPTTIDVGSNQIKRYTAEGGKLTGDYSFNVKAIESAYYMITVYPIVDKTKNEQTLPRGTIVLESFPEDEEKVIAFDHYFRKGEMPLWSVKFYSVNCKLHVDLLNAINEPVHSFGCPDGFCHHEISLTVFPEVFVLQKIKYKLKSEQRYGDDGDNTCKFYVATQERSQDDELVYGMNSPFKLFFDKNFPDTKLKYPFANSYNNAIMNLVLEDESHLNITVQVNGNKFGSYQTMKGRAIATKGLNKVCESKEDACVLEYSIRAIKETEINEGFIVDFSIKSSTLIPSYLERRKIREEFMFADDTQYYVADVGNDEEGTVQVHFNRGKGKIFARIVRKDQVDQGEGDKYRGRVILPKPDTAELKMDQFTMQIRYNTSKYNCTGSNQCEIYIGVKDTQIYYDSTASKYLNDFSIYIKANKANDMNKNSVVDIPLNEYISGSLTETRFQQDKQDVYDYFKFNVPVNVTQFTIEFYTEAVDLYINEGMEKAPSDKDSKYKLETDGGPGMLTIKSETGGSLKNNEYYIAIGTDKIDQVVAARYMIRIIAIERGIQFNQELNSDDSILSRVVDEDEKKENKYAYFIQPIRDYDRTDNMDMYLYAYSRTTTDLQIYVNFITEDEYASAAAGALADDWPTEDRCQVGTKYQYNKDYLYIPSMWFTENKFMLISVKAPKNELFYLTSTNRLQLRSASLVPFSTQVFDIDWKYELEVNYPDDYDYLLHITCINGAGTVRFGGKAYDLKGIHDTLIITTNRGDVAKGKKIEVISADDAVGFDIMTQYNIRPEYENFDEVRYGENGEIVIMDDDLPLIFYSKLYKPEDLAFNFKFNDFDIKSGGDKQKAYDLVVSGGIVDYSEIIKKRNNHNHTFDNPSTYSGLFDKSGMAMMYVLESEINDTIEKFNISNPYLYFAVSKSEKNTQVFQYIHGEFSFLPSSNIDVPAPINQYTSSYLHVENTNAMFRLKREDLFHTTLILQFSSPSTNLHIAFQDTKPSLPFYTNISEIVEGPKGKRDHVVIKFNPDSDSVYMCVFAKQLGNEDSKNASFTFKYRTGYDGSSWELPTKDYDINRYKGENIVYMKVPQVPFADKKYSKATYTIKLIDAASVGTEIDISSIAISFLTYKFTQTYTTNDTEQSQELFIKEFDIGSVKLDDKADYYAAVTAYLPDYDELVSYGLKKFKGEGVPREEKSSGKWWIILIIIGVAIALLASGILLSKYLQAKKDTETNMMKTSFIGSNLVPGEDEEKNILK